MKRNKRWFLAALLQLLAAASLLVASRQIDGFAAWHEAHVYPLFVNTLGRLWSIVPFSVVEIGLYALLIGLLVTLLVALVRMVLRIVRKEAQKVRPITTWACRTLCLASLLLLLYTLTCGINYATPSFSERAGYPIQASTKEELRVTCEMLIDQINAEVDNLTYDEAGSSVLPADAGKTARRAMQNLGQTWEFLDGYYPNPKKILVSEILSYQFLTGVYSPFTVEANYNGDMPDMDVPATMCHELSHLKGFMREDEAGFLAYLACTGSDDAMFRYSGAMHALTYCLNAYYDAVDGDTYRSLYYELDERAIQDRRNNSQWWEAYRGKISEAANTVNDTYLKANNQTDGVASYGRMADLMIAYWRQTGQNQEE